MAIGRLRWWSCFCHSRPGSFVVRSAFYIYLRRCGFLWKQIDRRCVALALSPAGLALFMLHLYRLTGNPFAYVPIQSVWGNSVSCTFSFVLRFWQSPTMIGHCGWDPEFLSVVLTLSVMAVLVWDWR